MLTRSPLAPGVRQPSTARRVDARAGAAGSEPQSAITRRELLATGSVLLTASPLPVQAASAGAASRAGGADRVDAYVRFITDLEARGTAPLVSDFPAGRTWFNSRPLSFDGALGGRVVVLDFWTLCCVNCMHVLPELAALEQKYREQPAFAVVGVHSPKFSDEKTDESVRGAVLRYDVTHPVVNDSAMALWRALEVQSWPTLVVVGPTRRVLAMWGGEGHAKDVDDLVAAALRYYGAKGLLTQSPLPLALERDRDPRTLSSPLSFPGKIAADVASNRLFISDSGHHRIVATSTDGAFLFAVGGDSGPGLADGTFEQAAFNRPQGVAYDPGSDTLYVADTENHALRGVNLATKTVTTLAGDGTKGRDYRGGGSGAGQRLNSPWDVALLPGGDVVVALAGQHQLWRFSAATRTCAAFSGDGYERNGNGATGPGSSWAQPSGLAVDPGDSNTLYVADSESSSIRACSLSSGGSALLAGGDALYADDLFRFGDADGKGAQVRLQHPLAVAAGGPGVVFIADSYNHKIKVLDVAARSVATVAGTGSPGPLFEPSGLAFGADGLLYIADTNNGAIKVLDTRAAQPVLTALELRGIPLPKAKRTAAVDAAADANTPPPVDADAVLVRAAAPVGAASGTVSAVVTLPRSYHLTEGAGSEFSVAVYPPGAADITLPSGSRLEAGSADGAATARLGFTRRPGSSAALLRVTCRVFYCQTAAVCLYQSVVFDLPLAAAVEGTAEVLLSAAISPPQAPRGGLLEL